MTFGFFLSKSAEGTAEYRYNELMRLAETRDLTESEMSELRTHARVLGKESAIAVDLVVAKRQRSG